MIGFPLLLIPLAVYNIIVFLMPGVSFAEPLVRLTLTSGAEWQVTLSDVLLALGILLLLLEVIKGARPGTKYLTDHLLSLILFGAAATEFVLWTKFGNSTFFLLLLLSLVDFLSGVALHTRRGKLKVADSSTSRKSARSIVTPAAEPQFNPEPAPAATTSSVPTAASVAESVLMDRPEPAVTQPAVVPGPASPEVASPQLQPGTNPSSDTPRR